MTPGLDYWLWQDDDNTPWLLVSHDFAVGNAVRDTLRLDFDHAGIQGGWSPASLNWDGEVRAEAADIDTTGPDGINLPAGHRTPVELARVAAEWFADHRRRWRRASEPPTNGRWPTP